MLSRFIDRLIIKQPRLRRFLTRLLWTDRSGFVQLFGTRIFANSLRENGYYRAQQIANRSSLWRDESAVLVTLALLLEDGDTFVDAGANVGVYSAVLARAASLRPGMKFYAFEANPDTFKRLARTIEGLPVQAANVALSDHEGTLSFVDGAVSHVFTTVDNASSYNIPGTTSSVACTRLDNCGIAGNSVVIKIDVEGQERAVLDGARGLFEAGRVKAVYLDGFKDRSIPALLLAKGFVLVDGHTMAAPAEDVFSLLAVRS